MANKDPNEPIRNIEEEDEEDEEDEEEYSEAQVKKFVVSLYYVLALYWQS